MGVPITNLTQVNNTYYVSDGLSRVLGTHTLKLGAQFHIDQVNEHPNATFNGTFNINGTETGDPYADFLLGTPEQLHAILRPALLSAQSLPRPVRAGQLASAQRPHHQRGPALGRHHTLVGKIQSTSDLGRREHNRRSIPEPLRDCWLPAILAFRRPSPRPATKTSPRASASPTLQSSTRVFGAKSSEPNGQSSIRASYGLFYTAFQGLSAGIMYAVPPFGFNYLSPAPPLFATPFITAATGFNNGQRFPFPFPSHNVSVSNPDNSVDWDNFIPLAADPFFYYRNRVPYVSSYMFSIQRQITRQPLLTMSYVGNQGHHILTLVSANPGDRCALPQPRWLRSVRRRLHLHQQCRSDSAGNSRRSRTGIRRKHRRQIHCQLELTTHSKQPSATTPRLPAPDELHLRQVDRSGLQSRRATQSN